MSSTRQLRHRESGFSYYFAHAQEVGITALSSVFSEDYVDSLVEMMTGLPVLAACLTRFVSVISIEATSQLSQLGARGWSCEAYGPQRCYWGTDLTNGFGTATYRQRVTHFTEQLSFLSEDDKDWIMGRAIQARLGWS